MCDKCAEISKTSNRDKGIPDIFYRDAKSYSRGASYGNPTTRGRGLILRR